MLEDDVFFADIDAGETKFVRHAGHRAHVCIRDGGADDSFLADEAVGAIGRHIAVDEVLDGIQIVYNRDGASRSDEYFHSGLMGLFQCVNRRSRDGMCAEAHECPVNVKKQSLNHNMYLSCSGRQR